MEGEAGTGERQVRGVGVAYMRETEKECCRCDGREAREYRCENRGWK